MDIPLSLSEVSDRTASPTPDGRRRPVAMLDDRRAEMS